VELDLERVQEGEEQREQQWLVRGEDQLEARDLREQVLTAKGNLCLNMAGQEVRWESPIDQ